MADIVRWTGNSGSVYDFELYPISTDFNPIGACYIFTKRMNTGDWQDIYIGQTQDLSERFDNHHAMPCIRQNGATHICIYTAGMHDPVARTIVENDLLINRNPPCNG